MGFLVIIRGFLCRSCKQAKITFLDSEFQCFLLCHYHKVFKPTVPWYNDFSNTFWDLPLPAPPLRCIWTFFFLTPEFLTCVYLQQCHLSVWLCSFTEYFQEPQEPGCPSSLWLACGKLLVSIQTSINSWWTTLLSSHALKYSASWGRCWVAL